MNTSRIIGSTALAGLMLGAALTPASADTTGHWATIEDYAPATKTATVSISPAHGFPLARLTTDSVLADPLPTGASKWLAASTEVGAVYGTSMGQPYLNLRPVSSTTPSTTIYSFESPTPSTGWSFTLGDIDAEFLDVAATGLDGQPVQFSELGFRTTFNYCVGAGTPSCERGKPQLTPAWDPATGRLAGPRFDPGDEEITGWSDTEGAAAWFEPTVPLKSLTVRSTRREGSPIYQTWFAALSRDITGTVTGTADCPAADLEVVVLDGDGNQVAETTTTPDGTWTLPNLATYDDWTVTVTPPKNCVVDPDSNLIADLSEDDAVVDADLRPEEGPEPTPEPTTPEPTTPAPTTPAPTAAPASPPTDVSSAAQASSSLPDTGGSSPWWLIGGGALLLSGAAALVVGSRRRR